jgi:TetR/AcrR family transcriptional regulator, transcriptional repressor for nem operon
MRITCANLYNAFGDERALFRRALQRYLNDRVRDRIARHSRLPPRAAIAAYFREGGPRLLAL